jgi:hypothetical protein
VHESICDHCTNMLYPFIVTVVDLYQNCLCFKVFHNIFISFMVMLVIPEVCGVKCYGCELCSVLNSFSLTLTILKVVVFDAR